MIFFYCLFKFTFGPTESDAQVRYSCAIQFFSLHCCCCCICLADLISNNAFYFKLTIIRSSVLLMLFSLCPHCAGAGSCAYALILIHILLQYVQSVKQYQNAITVQCLQSSMFSCICCMKGEEMRKISLKKLSQFLHIFPYPGNSPYISLIFFHVVFYLFVCICFRINEEKSEHFACSNKYCATYNVNVEHLIDGCAMLG